MDTIYDLDDFSDNHNNLNESEEKSINNSYDISSISNPSNINLSLNKNFSAENWNLTLKNNLSEINSFNNINNNSIDESILAKKLNLDESEKKEIVKEPDQEISSFNKNIDNISEKDYAIEDNINISEFENIKEPAMKFDFTLDTFQKRSIIRLERGENILVCAHTSSGKTLVAEYGIALGKKKNQRVIYTSPIKALSNQKYCEFKKKFKDVGIITGDVNINPKAQCLIMTTEILHKYLYQNSNFNVGTVIFDEIHYINDLERGHIWEEILIVLPNFISIIMLSATIPNYFEFANWVGKIKKTKVYIEVTKTRVVPLQYYLYINKEGNEKVTLIKDKNGKIYDKEIKESFNFIKKFYSSKKENNEYNNLNLNEKNNNYISNFNGKEKSLSYSNKKYDKLNNENNIKEENNSSNEDIEENEINEINDEENNIEYEDFINDKEQREVKKLLEIVKYILNNNLYPATIFIFNIRKIKYYSDWLIKDNNLKKLSSSEKDRINNFFNKVISSIPEQEQNITQINYIKNLLQYGIGVHHSGLLPILKEIIEILYHKGLIKILIATTSFSIGLNMPTRTVVFISLYKYHEGKRQILSSSEFLQMSGRAGRRGIDELGHVYILCAETIGKAQLNKIKELLKGQGNELESKFRLSYRMILFFYHKNVKNIKDFFKESFHENHNKEIKPEKQNEIEKIKESLEKIKKIEYRNENGICTDIEESPMYKLIEIVNKIDSINSYIFNDEKIIKYISIHPCTIMKIKQKNNTTVNKFYRTDIVMVVNVLKDQNNNNKIWCLSLIQVDENKNYNKKEEEVKNEAKKQTIFYDRGQIQEFKYKYILINFSDIIEIYEKPKVEKIENFYQKEKLENYFIIHKGKYYFKYDMKCLYAALKNFYRAIINSFSKKSLEVTPKKGKNKKDNNIENKKKKPLAYKKIIGTEIEEKEKMRQKLLQQYNINECQKCKFFKEHLKLYKNVLNIKNEIRQIEKEISDGGQYETQKKFNNRIKLLKDLNYLKIDDDCDSDNDNSNYENFSLTTKGKASIEIITNDNIFITELLSSGIFIKDGDIISKEIIVPFISIFVGNEKMKDLKHDYIKLENEKNNEELKYSLDKFHNIYDKIVEEEKKYDLNESYYNRSFCFKYFESIYFWMLGNHFCEVCDKYKIVEGKLYQIILRTFYFAEEIVNFYNILGNKKLVDVFKDIKDKLLKGIMSMESLYIQENIDIDNI